jgi:hypothetical protein
MARRAAVIRPYREEDLGPVYDVRIRTADPGESTVVYLGRGL